MKYLLLSLLVLGTLHPAFSQNSAPRVILLSDRNPDFVDLRWAFAELADYQAATAGELRLDRIELNTSGGPTPDVAGSRVTLLTNPVPAPKARWLQLADTSYHARNIAGYLYPDEQPEAEERRFLYGLTLFSADHDFPAAVAGLLGYRDETAEADKIYEYQLSLRGETIATVRGLRGARQLPQPPYQVSAASNRVRAEISWNRSVTDGLYSSYSIQRSDDGGQTFRVINDRPAVQLLNEENYDTLQYYQDTFEREDVEYHYRVLGTTPFARFGTPSEVVTARALPDPRLYTPRITDMVVDLEENFRIEWDLPAGDNDRIAYYQVYGGTSGYADLEPRSGKIDPSARSWVETDPRDGRFYVVYAFSDLGLGYPSDIQLMLVDDRTPPEPPVGLTGEVDSTGRVTLRWNQSPSSDRKGYRVFTSNIREGYYPQLTERETRDTTFVDQVTMDTRTEVIYYKVLTVDFNGNYSAFSDTLTLSRPDFKPPTPPNFRNVTGSTAGVTFDLALSSSDDVLYHLFERRNEEGDWETLDTLRTVAATRFISDETGETGVTYAYRVVAVDDAALTSSTEIVESQKTDTGKRGDITNFGVDPVDGSAFTQVRWSYSTNQGLEGFQLYRAEGDAEVTAFKLLSARTPDLRIINGGFIFLDRTTKSGNTYTYRLLARHYDGGYSPFTDPISVTIR